MTLYGPYLRTARNEIAEKHFNGDYGISLMIWSNAPVKDIQYFHLFNVLSVDLSYKMRKHVPD